MQTYSTLPLSLFSTIILASTTYCAHFLNPCPPQTCQPTQSHQMIDTQSFSRWAGILALLRCCCHTDKLKLFRWWDNFIPADPKILVQWNSWKEGLVPLLSQIFSYMDGGAPCCLPSHQNMIFKKHLTQNQTVCEHSLPVLLFKGWNCSRKWIYVREEIRWSVCVCVVCEAPLSVCAVRWR